jgi:signal peptide peptidase SppA
MRYTALIAYMTGQSWALHQPVLEAAASIISARIAGTERDEEQIARLIAERDRRQDRRRADWGDYPGTGPLDEERGYFHVGGVAVVPVSGILTKYADMINGISQPTGMTTARVAEVIRQAARDRRSTAGVLLDIDSPGGTVAGVSDMAQAASEARVELEDSGRRLVALAHDSAYSAAYWLASQATEVYLGPSAGVGSIGVFGVMTDTSAAYEGKGIKRILLASGPHKGAGADGTKITAEHIDERMAMIQAEARAFKAAVAAGRDMEMEDVESVASGRVFIGEDAVTAGLADGVLNFGEIVEMMNDGALR